MMGCSINIEGDFRRWFLLLINTVYKPCSFIIPESHDACGPWNHGTGCIFSLISIVAFELFGSFLPDFSSFSVSLSYVGPPVFHSTVCITAASLSVILWNPSLLFTQVAQVLHFYFYILDFFVDLQFFKEPKISNCRFLKQRL